MMSLGIPELMDALARNMPLGATLSLFHGDDDTTAGMRCQSTPLTRHRGGCRFRGMASCERCWRDARLIADSAQTEHADEYRKLVAERDRAGETCSPQDQA